jgi:hypothetical protein
MLLPIFGSSFLWAVLKTECQDQCFVLCFLGQFCDVAKVVIIHPSSDLAKFGYKLNMKVHYIKKETVFYIFGYLVELMYRRIWKFFLNFFRIMAIENPKQPSILAPF